VSVYEDRILTCPHCQPPSTRSVAVSLDGAHAARERQEIFDGTFQRLTCAACGTSFRADGPLIYLDFDAKPDAPGRSAIVRIARAELDAVAAGRAGAWAATIEAVSAGPYVDLGRIFAPRPSDAVA